MNYNKEMNKIINLHKLNNILLHSCCGPCSSSVIEKLSPYFDITVLFYNPNIEPKEEYIKRKDEQIKLLEILNIKYLDIDYLNDEYRSIIKGYEEELENGQRCLLCYELRLNKTAKIAKENNFDLFTTTLTVSPYKNSKIINEVGIKIGKENNVLYLVSDFKKEAGYKRSIELSKKYNIYRQDYCGCIFSKRSK
ncbi:MAG: epoxyqueuosine reductase QueH [Bacilli bacterium]|nr:epoxyqueuosine reductase QueH [Bacilli bacterium]MDD4406470.1 epoxyqueuosine reductase QueH [Bacilli bacterium]